MVARPGISLAESRLGLSSGVARTIALLGLGSLRRSVCWEWPTGSL